MYPESRSRMISFRLTDQEYERFRQLCSLRGHGSVSAMVRAAVHHLLGDTDQVLGAIALEKPPQPEIQARVAILESRVASLASALAQIDGHLNHSVSQSTEDSNFR